MYETMAQQFTGGGAFELKAQEYIKETFSASPILKDTASPPHTLMSKRSLSMVFGNLDGLGDLPTLIQWLTERLKASCSPAPPKTCSKGEFKGILLAEFGFTDARDRAVVVLCAIAPTSGEK